MTTNDKFQAWAIVELYGHQRIAGLITEATIGGCPLIRVDVPTTKHHPGFTRFLGNGAIYAINPVSEEIAQAAAENLRAAPIQPYELPQLRQKRLFEPTGEPDDS